HHDEGGQGKVAQEAKDIQGDQNQGGRVRNGAIRGPDEGRHSYLQAHGRREEDEKVLQTDQKGGQGEDLPERGEGG
ncbi:unnamed protein product, partial [Ectocarpus fasciculatus]